MPNKQKKKTQKINASYIHVSRHNEILALSNLSWNASCTLKGRCLENIAITVQCNWIWKIQYIYIVD